MPVYFNSNDIYPAVEFWSIPVDPGTGNIQKLHNLFTGDIIDAKVNRFLTVGKPDSSNRIERVRFDRNQSMVRMISSFFYTSNKQRCRADNALFLVTKRIDQRGDVHPVPPVTEPDHFRVIKRVHIVLGKIIMMQSQAVPVCVKFLPERFTVITA